jgi:hypothetical protein
MILSWPALYRLAEGFASFIREFLANSLYHAAKSAAHSSTFCLFCLLRNVFPKNLAAQTRLGENGTGDFDPDSR